MQNNADLLNPDEGLLASKAIKIEKPYKANPKPTPLSKIAKASGDTSSPGSNKLFVAVMRGEYWTKREQFTPSALKPYKAAFVLNQAQAKIAISYIRAYLLSPKLKERHPDFNHVYTHHLVALHPKADPSSYVGIPYHWMGLAQVERLIEDQSIPLDPAAIADLHELRNLVRTWCENPVDKTSFNLALTRAQKNLRRSLKGLEDGDLAPVSAEDDFDEDAAILSSGVGRVKLDANMNL